MNQAIVGWKQLRGKANLLQAEHRARFIEQAQHETFAEGRGHHGDTDIDFPVAHSNGDTSILWQTRLRNVQIRHDFETRGNAGLERFRWAQDLVQDAINAIPYLQ